MDGVSDRSGLGAAACGFAIAHLIEGLAEVVGGKRGAFSGFLVGI